MGAVAFLIVWAGYSVFTYGVATVRGCNITWSQIAIPGRWSSSGGCNPDQGSSAGGGQTTFSGSNLDQASTKLRNATGQTPGVTSRSPNGTTTVRRSGVSP